MNTKEQEKATPEGFEQALITFIKSGSANGNEAMRQKSLKLVPKIVKAVNEYEALCAVAEAAKQHRKLNNWRTEAALDIALDSLEIIRSKGK